MYRYLVCMTFFLSPASWAQAPYPQGQTYRMVGPVVDVLKQAVSLSIAVIATPFRLHYRNGGVDRMWSWSVHLMTPREKCCASATVGRDRQADYFVSGRATRTGPRATLEVANVWRRAGNAAPTCIIRRAQRDEGRRTW